MYLGRALRTKETLPDFRKRCRVTRHSRIFRGLTGSQRTPRILGITKLAQCLWSNLPVMDASSEFTTSLKSPAIIHGSKRPWV